MTAAEGSGIRRLAADAAAIAEDVRQTFGGLRPSQLNWKPGTERWSVAECLEHLILINSAYFPVFHRIERGDHRPGFAGRIPVLPKLFGALVKKAVRPETAARSRTRPEFTPRPSGVDAGIVDRFVAHQQDVIAHMTAAEGLDPARVIVTSPVAWFVTYSLLDAYWILVTHERRHVAQARRVLEAPGFPA